MRNLLRLGIIAAGAALAGLAFAGTANADPATWSANPGSTIVDSSTVTLTADPAGANTSVETTDLGVTLMGDTTATFTYQLADGATCAAGAPRVYLVVNGTNVNSWDQRQPAGTQCGDAGVVTFTVPAGTITAAGVVYDNGDTAGTVTVSDLTIGDQPVKFCAPPADDTSTPPSSSSADTSTPPATTSSPPASHSGGMQPIADTSSAPPASLAGDQPAAASSELANTGAGSVGALAGIGAALVLVGVSTAYAGRRRARRARHTA